MHSQDDHKIQATYFQLFKKLQFAVKFMFTSLMRAKDNNSIEKLSKC
jgi:hypothetical protein